MLPLASQVTADIDSEMASPIEPLDSTHIGSGVDEYELGACAEIETPGDLTTRTIKKLRSLRRSNTSNRQQQHQEPSNQEDFGSKPASRSGSISGVPGTATSISSKAKIMKRSKTIVFRPEVAMQPLSSKNVIPPWNRIPSFSNSSNSSNSSAAPISPISPTIQHSATTLPISATSSTISTINTTMNEQIQASSPPSSDVDELCYQQQQPRKLTMSHSKTMSSISTIPSWSIGNNHADYPTLSPGPLASLMPSPTSSNTNNGVNVRSMSMTSGMTPTTLVAPWNRANGNGDTNTHLHSLIKVSGQISPSLQSPMDSPFIPVELGRSFHKKESQAQKSPSNRGVRDRSVPLLAQPPEARNRNSENGSSSFPGGSISKNRVRKPGMTHSVSAPGGFLPIMTISAPDGISKSTDASDGMTGHPSIIKATPAATQKRTSLYSPSLPSKQPVGILKNAQRGIRKASLTVPGAVMFPVHASSMSMMASYSVSSSPSTSVSSIGNYGAGVLATTFKIVKDTDTIVALQVLEDSSFVLTLPELRSRVKAKLIKSNIQLPDQFDLLWTMPTNSMTLTSISTPMLGTSVTSIKQAANSQGVILKTDEDLHRAIHASRNHKVTLRCIV
ncbi:hypothetical protein FBU30_002854 [Linnemannia zychae]|nr:hypothetical protein FBU30_002854 [Linnemannia zychae]